ncbi:MAG TPA: amidohydrolase family protein [Polyangia bacterium]|jgi:imidazolonepropionase-like amidohydrolase|nr:amidohydrolase family protein [Polyangia bacterium]
MKRRSSLLATLLLAIPLYGALTLSTSAPGHAAPPRPRPPLAIVGGTVHLGTGEVIEQGVVLVEGGRIQRVGKGLAPPPGAEIIDAQGAVVTPGLTDVLTGIGLVEVAAEDATRDDSLGGHDLIRAAFRVVDGYNPASVTIGVTRAEGVTSVGVVPSGGLVSGQSAWADLDGATTSEAIAQAPLALHVHLRVDEKSAGHATALLRLREALDDARAFATHRAAWERNQSRPFAASHLDLEALGLALQRKVVVVFHVNRAADILAVLNVAREFQLRPVIAGGAEAWRVSDALAQAKVPVIVFPLVTGPESFDTLGAREDNAALLAAAGVPVILSTEETHNVRKLRQVAGNAVRAGLPHDTALAALTRVPAEAFGMGARYGTLTPGKVANIAIWSGDPLEIGTQVRALLIHGRPVSLRNRQTALFEKYRRPPR